MTEVEQSKELLQQKVDKFRRLYNGMCATVEGFEKQIVQLTDRTQFLEAQLLNADERVLIYKDAIKNNIDQTRKTELELVAEIKQLKVELKDARSQLGNKSNNGI